MTQIAFKTFINSFFTTATYFQFFIPHRYHSLYDEVKEEHDPKEEYEFEEQAKLFIDSYKAMQKKYQLLLIKQSQVSFS
jgi:hypothetical protein